MHSSPSSGVSWIRPSFTTFVAVYMQSCTNVVSLCIFPHDRWMLCSRESIVKRLKCLHIHETFVCAANVEQSEVTINFKKQGNSA